MADVLFVYPITVVYSLFNYIALLHMRKSALVNANNIDEKGPMLYIQYLTV